MMDISLIVYVIVYAVFAILMIWKTASMMIEDKNMGQFLPFFLVGVIASFQAAFTFYELYHFSVWVSIELLYVIVIGWIFAIIARRKEWF
jgi:hypothetical protein